MITTPVYATRELVRTATDVKETVRNNDLIDMVLQASARRIELETHRRFYPELATRKWDYPNAQFAEPWQLWLEDNELISISSMSSGGTVVPSSDYVLRRTDEKDEPPFNLVELKLDTASSLSAGPTFQQSIVITGLYGHRNDSYAQGTLTAAISSTSATTLSASDATIGVGSLLIIDSERLLVTDKSMVDSTMRVTANIDNQKGSTLLGVTTGSNFTRGETILVGAEKMRVDEVAGNNLLVTRGWEATTITAHAINDVIFALRTLNVLRGVLGTLAATHSNGAVINVFNYPALITDYSLALSLNDKRLATIGYTPGLTGNLELKALCDAVYATYARKGRLGAI